MERAAALVATLALLGAAAALWTGALPETTRAWLAGLALAPLVLVAALALALAALALAWRAMRRTEAMRRQLVVVTRSLDGALGEIERRSGRDAASLDELNRAMAREMGALKARLGAAPATPAEAAPAAAPEPAPGAATAAADDSNVIFHPATLRRAAAAEPAATSEAASGGAETALAAALEAGSVEVSLEPVISVTSGETAAYEVLAHVPGTDGDARDLRRPAAGDGLDPARFERVLIASVIAGARRHLGAAAERTPFHVPVSQALLAGGAETDWLAETLAVHPEVARSFVLSLPATAFDEAEALRGALRPFLQAGGGLAVEDWPGAPDAAALRAAGVTHVKLPAGRLLADRQEAIEAAQAAGLALVAQDVRSDAQAMALIDLGVELMCGPRFSLPRRVKPYPGPRSEPRQRM
ncbi:EAL domain-containing protein [Aquibium sp. A9E412]|uniref:EAL domain-containing protein n=1 Tax=Aquibium sp. A9E412 TaxID=2976767 RepID=UPI0025AF9E72|nr:EAL domain-containing protein [Aquibium sp. A9E412]MDN2566259.1 EAL domain-containing protein [Aquibium sp. A9E412]